MTTINCRVCSKGLNQSHIRSLELAIEELEKQGVEDASASNEPNTLHVLIKEYIDGRVKNAVDKHQNDSIQLIVELQELRFECLSTFEAFTSEL